MKKNVIGLSVIAALSLCAGTIPVHNSWSLAGAPSDISIDDVKNNSNCVKAIWQYDASNSTKPWSLYHRTITNHGYPPIANNTLKTYISEVLKLDDRVLCEFIINISFELDENDI